MSRAMTHAMRALFALMLGALAMAAAAPALAQSEFGVRAERVVSEQGIDAWLVSDDTVPMVVLRAYWPRGSASEGDGQAGVTSALADMLTEGSGDLDAAAFRERLEELNISIAFSAGWDGFELRLSTLSERLDEAFAMARLALYEPRFDAAPLERLRRQWLVGIIQRETNAGYLANLALDQALYPHHAYARRVSREQTEAISAAALRARAGELLTRDGLRVTVVGDIDAARLTRALDDLFAALPAGAPNPAIEAAALNQPTPLITRDLPQPQSLIMFAAPGIQDEDPDWIPLAVANYIFGGGGFSGRLMQEVRERRGMVYGIGTRPSVRDHVALISGSAQTENAKAGEAIRLIRAEMARFVADGATAAEVRDAITYLTGSFPLDLDSNVKIAGVLQSYQIAGRDIDYVNRRNALIRAVTLEDVNRVARRLYAPENFTFVVVGRPEGLEAPAGE